MQEAELYNYWEFYAHSAETLHWNNHSLKILQAGCLNEHQGPDIKYARFEFNNVVYQGAVEFHCENADWYKHNHQFDPAYQDVVLHIVAQDPEKEPYVRHNMTGHPIPVFVLRKPVLKNTISCTSAGHLNPQQIKERLQQLALERLRLKVRTFRKSLKSNSEHTLFYQGFLRVLGYPFNKSPFEMLALKIPTHIYEVYKGRPNLLLALYLGCSGFLNGVFKDLFAVKLQELFCHHGAILSSSLLQRNQWQIAATRPANHPQFRIAAWVAFLLSVNSQPPFNVLYRLLEQRLDYRETYDQIKKILLLKAEGYWRDHYALDRYTKQKKNNVYLGPSRINELIINLIIPLSMSKAYKNNNLGFVSYLHDFYLWLPGRCSYQSLFRKKSWLVDYKNLWQSCNTGQALLHLNELYCSRNQCIHCPLERKNNKIA